jgi:hypothetical protein
MNRQRGELIAVVLALLFGMFGVWLGTYDPLWEKLSIEADLRGSLTTALSLFLMLSGFFIAFYLQHAGIQEQLLDIRKNLPAELLAASQSGPQVDVFGVADGNQALRRLSERVKLAKVVLNTRITTGTSRFVTETDSLMTWERSIRAAVRSGTVFREIVSEGWKDLAMERAAELVRCKGLYEASCIAMPLPAVLNFIVLQYADGTKEVWFGWIMSSTYAFDQACIISSERRVVQLFENWHATLFSSGTPVGVGNK